MEKCNLEKIGSRRGRSYFTIRRKKKAVATMGTKTREQFSSGSISMSSVIRSQSEIDIRCDLDSTSCSEIEEDLEIDFQAEEIDAICLMSDSEDDEDSVTEEYHFMPEYKGSGRFDPKAVDIFKNLCFRHPALSHLFINDMLQCINEVGVDVPQDARTLLQSNKLPVKTRSVPPGTYWHYGIPKIIDGLLSRGLRLPALINLKVNVDGMPLAKSSKATFWPIQMTIDELKIAKPLLIGCFFHESSKPNNACEYLRDYVDDLVIMKTVGHNGIKVNKVIYPLDAPALAFVKQTQGHAGKNSCGKCDTLGEYKVGRTCFPTLIGNKREDVIFRNHTTYGKHHKSKVPGPLEHASLGTDMVDDFPAEPLHVFHLGVTKRIMSCWTGSLKLGASNSSIQVNLRIPDDAKISIDQHLLSIKPFHPSEYNRPSRKLSDLKHWKGGEFGCLLDHTAMVVFKDRISKEVYENFLLFHVATTICETNRHKALFPLSKEIYKSFLNGFKNLYGEYALVYNLHCLVHVPDDVMRFGPLESYSVTAFEARLGRMKLLVKGGNRRLEQLANRVYETMDNYIDSIKSEFGKYFI